MAETTPIHLMDWIQKNQQLFRPPVANKEVFPESETLRTCKTCGVVLPVPAVAHA
jgi:hypothetical protein